MATAPDADAVTVLAAASIGLTSNTNLFRGPLREPEDGIPVQAVFVLASGGAAPIGLMSSTEGDLQFSAIQIMVRGNNQDFSGGQTLARNVRNALHHQTVAGYITVDSQQSEPIYLGEDDAGRHLWSVNVEMQHCELVV